MTEDGLVPTIVMRNGRRVVENRPGVVAARRSPGVSKPHLVALPLRPIHRQGPDSPQSAQVLVGEFVHAVGKVEAQTTTDVSLMMFRYMPGHIEYMTQSFSIKDVRIGVETPEALEDGALVNLQTDWERHLACFVVNGTPDMNGSVMLVERGRPANVMIRSVNLCTPVEIGR